MTTAKHENNTEAISNLFTVKQFVAAHPWCTAGGIRAQIFFEEKNGLKKARAIIRMGRKILIDRERYLSWLLQENNKSSRAGG